MERKLSWAALCVAWVVGVSAVWMIGAPSAHAAGKKPPSAPVELRFPDGFQWCTATAAHQIEGGNTNSDWWQWEQDNWGVSSGIAVDHWNRVDEDIQLMKNINLKTYRFSIEWAKVQPTPDTWDPDAVEHYQSEIRKLKEAGIRPLITLHHWTFPIWVRERGGFEWAGLPEAFARYVSYVVRNIGPEVEDWVTLNEPMVTITLGYTADRQPPARRGESKPIESLIAPIRGMIKTHAAGYWAIKDVARSMNRVTRVGIANHLRVFDPEQPANLLDRIGAGFFDHAFNWMVSDAIETGRLAWPPGYAMIVALFFPKLATNEAIPEVKGTQDYFGLNYYARDLLHVDLSKPPASWLKMVGGQTGGEQPYPSGLYRLVMETHRRYPRLPIIITENGLDDDADLKRPKYLEEHLYALHRAIKEGAPVYGYCHWSLLDNFEWTLGFAPRFGLYHVDRSDNLKRTLRPSGMFFSDIARNNGFWTTPIPIDK